MMVDSTKALDAVLDAVDDYLAGREDVIDGPDCRPLPNDEMNLLRELRDARALAQPAGDARDADGDRFRKLLELLKHDWCVSRRPATGGGVYQYDERSLRGAIDALTQEQPHD